MNNFAGKTAVITGGASGIGLGIARRCAQHNMHILLADIEAPALDAAAAELSKLGSGELMVQQVDVGDSSQMEKLADLAFDNFEAIHLLFNNAGVGGGGQACWELELDYWDWVFRVNVWGVIHGIKYFVPRMLQQNEGHITNTASVAGLMSAPGSAAYNVSKHAVVTLSETLSGDLRNAGSKLGVSVLCPSYVNSKIYAAERNRPGVNSQSEEQMALHTAAGEFFDAIALSTDTVAEQVFEAIAAQAFYILPHAGARQQVEARMRGILDNQPPTLTGAEDFPLN